MQEDSFYLVGVEKKKIQTTTRSSRISRSGFDCGLAPLPAQPLRGADALVQQAILQCEVLLGEQHGAQPAPPCQAEGLAVHLLHSCKTTGQPKQKQAAAAKYQGEMTSLMQTIQSRDVGMWQNR